MCNFSNDEDRFGYLVDTPEIRGLIDETQRLMHEIDRRPGQFVRVDEVRVSDLGPGGEDVPERRIGRRQGYPPTLDRQLDLVSAGDGW